MPLPTRRSKTTSTWLKRTTVMIAYAWRRAPSSRQRDRYGQEADWLLGQVLEVAPCLANYIPDDKLEERERQAKALVKYLKNRRLSPAMENMAGRTAEETALFREWLDGR